MRVLIVNNFARVTGGADRHCLDLATWLRGRGHDVAFLATRDSRNPERTGAFISCAVTRETRDSIRGTAALGVAARTLWNRDAARATRELIESFQPEVVHCHKLYPQLSVAPVVTASGAGAPIVQTAHDYELISASAFDDRGSPLDRIESSPRYRALNDITFPIRRLIYSPRVTSWVAVSRSMAEHLSAKGIEAEVIPNFVAPAKGAPRGAEMRRGVAYVGRLASEKGVRDVLELAASLETVEVSLAGDGPLAGDVRLAAGEHENVVYRGSLERSEVSDLISGSRAILMPSLWEEPGPLVALEAMALGTPVIAYRRGGLAEYVEDAGAGVVVERSPGALARAVTEVLGDGGRWERLSSAGVDAIAGRHSAEHCVRMYEEAYARARG
jgi:glycosyltransferase involved in cell wall biosynthesis